MKKLVEWKCEETLEGTPCTVVVFNIDLLEDERARGEISVAFETVKKVIHNPWVARLSDGEWLVSRTNDGRSDFIDLATRECVFAPYNHINDVIKQFIAQQLGFYLQASRAEAEQHSEMACVD